MDEQMIRSIVEDVIGKIQKQDPLDSGKIPIAVSARHVHLTEPHIAVLFGENYQLTPKNPLSQPGQFAAQEQVTIVGPKASIYKVRVLGPPRSLSQVEISMTDARILGIEAPLRYSGQIEKSAPITLVGPKGSLFLQEGCIIAAAHIHMSEKDATNFRVVDGQFVNVRANSARPIIFNQVKVRVSNRFQLEMHIDTDEGNAAFIQHHTFGEILTEEAVHPIPVTNTIHSIAPDVSNKKLISEKDICNFEHTELYIKKGTIVTALAYDQARKRGIRIVRQ